MTLQLMAGAFALKVFGTNSLIMSPDCWVNPICQKSRYKFLLWDDMQTSLTNLIHFSDSRSMWHSINKDAILDHDIEFFSEPPAYKLNNGTRNTSLGWLSKINW